MNRRPLALAAPAAALFLVWLAWGVAHPTPQTVTVYVPYMVAPVAVEMSRPPVIAPEQPQEQPEQRFTASAAVTTARVVTTLVEQTPVGPAEVTYLEFVAVIATTWWAPAEWGYVWTLARCESPGSSIELVAVHAIGDQGLVDEGPSLGAVQTNIRAHPGMLLKYNLLDLRDNLLAGYEIWEASGRTFVYDWKNCSGWRGLP